MQSSVKEPIKISSIVKDQNIFIKCLLISFSPKE